MGSKLGSTSEDVISDINITPFVDIILVVLIIFMVTATTIVKQSIKVQLPEAATAEALQEDSIGLTLTDRGQLLLDGEPSSIEAVQGRIRGDKAQNRDVVVLIAADKLVAYGRLIWLIDLIKSEGVANFAFNVDKTQAIPPDPATTGAGLGTPPSGG
jgi:biopolymer transport protein ExbD